MSCTEFELFALVSTETTINDLVQRVAQYKSYWSKDYSVRVQILFPVHWISTQENHHKCWEAVKIAIFSKWQDDYNLEFSSRANCYKDHFGLHYSLIVESKKSERNIITRLYDSIPYEIDTPIGANYFVNGYLYAGGKLENLNENCIIGTATVKGYPIYPVECFLQPLDCFENCYCYIIQHLIRGYTPFQIWAGLKRIKSNIIILDYMNFLDDDLGFILYQLLHSQSFEQAIAECYTQEHKLLIAGLAAIKFKPEYILKNNVSFDYIYRLVTYCP